MPNPTVEYLISVSRVIFLLFGLTTVSMAQDALIKRGFQPGNSFSIGDFETINTTNGNLMLRFPLGSLPGGRNGLSASINLFYNSKVFDSETQWFVADNQSCEIVGDLAGEGILRCPYYQKSVLKESPQGGWQFGTMYTLKLIDRRDQFLNIPPEKQPQCLNSNSYGSWSPGYYEMRYHYKLILNSPDGSSHEMRPNGWSDGNFNDPLGDWFDIRPDGYWFDCQNTQWYQNTITYYSVDGSFLRLDIQHDNDTDPMNNPWTLYFADGSKVTSNQPNNEPQRFYDRNNNYLDLLGSEIRDEFNRSIGFYMSWNNGDPISTVTSQGFGETLTWTIHWKFISVLKNYWPCAQSLQCPPSIQQQEPYGYPRLVIDTITMPPQAGGLSYQFHYNAPDHVSGQPLSPSLGWGEISGITLPSGAKVSYTWAQDGTPVTNFTPDILQNAPTTKVVHYDQEYDGGITPAPEENWTFDISPSGTSIVTAPDGGVTMTGFTDPSAPFWNAGLTFSTTGPDGTRTETIWERNNLANNASTNPYPKTVFTSITNAAGDYVKTSIKDYKYDKNGNVTRVAEYDWVNYDDVPRSFGMATGLPAGVSPTRVTVNTYFNSTPDATQFAGSNTSVYWSSGSPRVKNAIASSEVRKVVPGGAEVALSRTEYTYDNPSVPANVTQVRSWDSAKGGYTNPLTSSNSLVGTTQYNQYGMPTLISDARGVQTLMTYGPIGTTANLYPTQIKTAYQTGQERTESREYNLATGLVTKVTDVDNNVSTATTYDPLGRPTLVTAAEGKPEETRTSYQYSDLLRRVITRSDLITAGDGKLVSIQHYDQLGRVRLSRRLEDASSQSATDENAGIKVQTRYRYSGANSYVLISNAYRAATSAAANSEQTMGWTATKSDNTGRVIEVQTFGGAALPAPWGSNSTSTGTVNTTYDANFTTVSDQTQKQRRSVFDGLERLLRVDEPNANGNLGSVVSPNQPTHYSYDLLGNLTLVTQSEGTTTQQRTFTYSSLSRLTQATTPENGTTNYQFDDVGNLVVRTDARGISTHYSYDALNRITRRWYNGSSSVSATTHEQALPGGVAPTDEVRFYYDLQTLPQGAPAYSRGAAMGRLVAQIYGAGTNGDYLGYSGVGRPILKLQQTGSVNYRVAATYNLGGAMTSLTYPSDHSITNTFDQAGRLTVLNGNIGDGAPRTYSMGILYSPAGAMVKEQFGTDKAIYNKRFYNSRGQLAEIRTSTSIDPIDSADRGAIINSYSDQCSGVCYGSSMTDNNGNLKKQDVLIPNQPTRGQQYGYDSLNRVKWSREVLNGVEQWKQQFTYDRWGNRKIDTAVTYGIGINNKNVDVNPSTNRLSVPSGQSGLIEYDAAGNLKNDTYSGAGARAYDAENKITSAGGWDNQAQLYSYDGSGQRIKRTAYGVQTWHVYGFGGELLAEYPANGAAGLPQKEYGYRNGQLLVTAEPTTAAPVNVASAANGATATASSSFSGFAVSGAINGDRKGLYVAQNGYWSTAGPGFSAWLEVQFNGSKTIAEIDVVTTQDQYSAPVEPTEATTFSLYGLTAYQIEYWNGSAWAVIPGSTVSSNNKVWRKFSFGAITTTKIRVLTNASVDNYSRITEVEAWTGPSPAPRYNLALSSMGAVATASNSYNSGYGPGGANNGDRKSTSWTNGGGWNDSGPPFPDWLQIDFGSVKTINEVNVFTLQDNYANSAEPTESMTFTLWGLTGYHLEYWDGSNWVSPANCSIMGNNKIWRRFNFSPISTSKIRIVTNASVDGYSRITEVEAYAPADTGASGNGVHWLVADHLGTPRMIFDQTGDLENIKRHDYLPFGEELFGPAGGRTAAQGYGTGDGVRQQFTSKERDVETSLDYFGARFYSPALGRFASCDPNANSARHIVNPQRWNLYSHVLNNPLVLYDPDGQIDQTKDKTKVIVDIFLFSNPASPGDKMTRAQRRELDNIVRQGKRVGVEINVFEGPAGSTGPAAVDSLKNSNVVIFGPHTGAPEGGEPIAVPTQDGLFTREGLNMAGEVEPRPVEVNASIVGVMGCDSALVRHVFYGADTFIGVNGGSDHVSTTYTLNNAIIAMADAIVDAKGNLSPKTTRSIASHVQQVILRTPYPETDKGDKVVINPAVVPPPPKKTPYEEEEL